NQGGCHMIRLFDIATTQEDKNGVPRTAFRFTREEVSRLLGRDYSGSSKDKGRLVAALLQAGAHEWVKTGEVLDREEDLLVVGPAIEYVSLAPHSYHYCGYDDSDPWYEWGYTAVRVPDPEDRTIYADQYVTHIEVRPDVGIQTNDADGACVVWGKGMPCPFVRLED